MKAKDIIKQYCTNSKKSIIGLIALIFASVILLIGFPILLKYIIELFGEINVMNTSISNYNAIITTLSSSTLETAENMIDGYRTLITELQASVNSRVITEIILCVSLGVSSLLNFYINILLDKQISSFGNDITVELKKAAYSSLLHGELYEINNISVDDVQKIIMYDTYKIGNKYFASHLLKLLYGFISYLATLVTLFCFAPTCGLIVLISCPILYFVSSYIGKVIKKKDKINNTLMTNQESELNYNISSLKSVKIRNGILKEENEYNELLKENKKINNSENFYSGIKNNFLNRVICEIVITGFVAIFIWQVSSTTNYSLGNIVASIVITPLVYNLFKSVIDCYFDKQYIGESYKNINSLLELRPESRSETIASLNEIHTLSFNNVSFEYSALNQSGVEKINFELKKGEKLGILGYQKSGKTTIADLTAKIIRPRFGNVLINNCDINKLNTAYLRDIIAYVPQDFNVFNGTVEQNIVYPMDLDEYRYNDALNKCKLKTLLMNLPKRDQENVLDIKLSPSDVERIGLAYAMYKDSPIMILDEATNKLDQISENEIMQEFYKLKNKMIIVISNRISTLMKCDKILIINEGKVVEYGKTEDLMNDKRSTYSKMISDVSRKIV